MGEKIDFRRNFRSIVFSKAVVVSLTRFIARLFLLIAFLTLILWNKVVYNSSSCIVLQNCIVQNSLVSFLKMFRTAHQRHRSDCRKKIVEKDCRKKMISILWSIRIAENVVICVSVVKIWVNLLQRIKLEKLLDCLFCLKRSNFLTLKKTGELIKLENYYNNHSSYSNTKICLKDG